MFKYNKKEISQFLSEFIWDFKLGDNIAYNFKILFILYRNKEKEKEEDKKFYNKLITIILVSIIEAILVDLLKRLDDATNDFPTCLNEDPHINKIKTKITSAKKIKNIKNIITGEAHRHYIMKRYNFNEIVDFCKNFNLLFSGTGRIYVLLEKFAWLRNRIHIENYFNNFEENEIDVFTELRLNAMEEATSRILYMMSDKYSRNLIPPQKQSNAEKWLEIMT